MKILSILALSCALVACGGGGGTTDVPAPAVTTPAPAQLSALNAWKALMTTGGTWSTSGKGSDGATYDLTTVITPKGLAALKTRTGYEPVGAAIPSTNFNSSEVVTTTRKNGALAGSDTKLFYLDQTTTAIRYLIAPSLPSCVPADSNGQVPSTSALNTSGFMFTGYDNAYSNSICYSNPFAFGGTTYRLTWSYESEMSLPLFCLNYTTRTWGQANTTVQSSCFETNAAGMIGTKARLSVTSGTFTLVSKNY